MWVSKINIDIRKLFLGLIIIVVICFTVYGCQRLLPWLVLSMVSGILGTFGYLMYTQGFLVRLYPNIWKWKSKWEVRQFIKPKDKYENYLLLQEGHELIPKAISSAIYTSDVEHWKLLDILRVILESHKLLIRSKFLLLGGGGGSFIYTVLKRYKNSTIDAVEISSEIISIAKHYFLKNVDLSRVQIIKNDGIAYLKDIDIRALKYDVIIIDMFADGNVPDRLYDPSFLRIIKRTLKKDGVLFVNFGVIGISNINLSKLKHIYLNGVFKKFAIYISGTSLIGTNKKLEDKPNSYVRLL